MAAMESLELINDIAEESRPRRVSSLFMVRSASRARMVGCAMFAAAGFLVFATVLIATRPRGAVADICKTKSCGTLAAELVKTMNTSADPCTVRTRYEQLRPHNSSSCSQCSCIAGGRVFRTVQVYCCSAVVGTKEERVAVSRCVRRQVRTYVQAKAAWKWCAFMGQRVLE